MPWAIFGLDLSNGSAIDVSTSEVPNKVATAKQLSVSVLVIFIFFSPVMGNTVNSVDPGFVSSEPVFESGPVQQEDVNLRQ